MTPDNAEMIPAKTPAKTLPLRQLACAQCGAAFACGTGGKNGNCWCMEEASRLPMPVAGAGDCLCPTCLRAALAAQPEMRPA